MKSEEIRLKILDDSVLAEKLADLKIPIEDMCTGIEESLLGIENRERVDGIYGKTFKENEKSKIIQQLKKTAKLYDEKIKPTLDAYPMLNQPTLEENEPYIADYSSIASQLRMTARILERLESFEERKGPGRSSKKDSPLVQYLGNFLKKKTGQPHDELVADILSKITPNIYGVDSLKHRRIYTDKQTKK